jgi:hypothetical protein
VKAQMEVVNRPLRYATRRMLPGDTFLAKKRDAYILIHMKRAREARPLVDIPPPPGDLIDVERGIPFDHDGDGHPGGSLPADQRGLEDLRAQAAALGITVDRRWGERKLLAVIAGARGLEEA